MSLLLRRSVLRMLCSVLAVVPFLSACSLDIPVENELTDPKAISSVQTAYEALASAYSSYPKVELELSLLSDELVPTHRAGQSPQMAQLYAYTDYALQSLASDLWSGYYETIKDANAVLVRLPDLRSRLSSAEQLQLDYLAGEAKTLKALSYLQLLQLFATPYDDAEHTGGIILKDRVEREELPRSTKAETVQAIERLLKEALTAFDTTTRPPYGSAPGFVNAATARALLARLYLYAGDWAKAEEVTRTLVPATLSASMVPTTPLAWSQGASTIALFASSVPVTYYNSIYAQSKSATNATYQLPQRSYLASTDLRHRSYALDSTLQVDATTTRSLQIIGKYAAFLFAGGLPSYNCVVRTTEPIFLRAEALARSGDETAARDLLNSYLRLVGADEVASTVTGSALIDAIIAEKAREFAGEGLRFFDLKRLGLPIEHYTPNEERVSLTLPAGSYKRTLPLPASERSNKNLGAQNPGWPELTH